VHRRKTVVPNFNFFTEPGGILMIELLKLKKSALTVREVAEILSLSEREIYKLAASNRIPHFRIGASVRFDSESLVG
jgi:excisionase family DNA binding protein